VARFRVVQSSMRTDQVSAAGTDVLKQLIGPSTSLVTLYAASK
jgi:hypothetical protein